MEQDGKYQSLFEKKKVKNSIFKNAKNAFK